MTSIAILGDIHGDYERMLQVVADLDPEVPLVVVGDYFDRWDHAVEAVHWLMQRPNTTALMGNHDALILGVVEDTVRGQEGRNLENWLWNGGKVEDLHRLMAEPEAIEWLRARPAMVMLGDTLVQHSDSPVYATYGDSVDAINRSVRQRVESRDPEVLFHLFADLCKRRQFYSAELIRDYLGIFKAAQLIHGHTPHTQPQAISMFGGAIINVDGAMSRGFGPEPRGFIPLARGRGRGRCRKHPWCRRRLDAKGALMPNRRLRSVVGVALLLGTGFLFFVTHSARPNIIAVQAAPKLCPPKCPPPQTPPTFTPSPICSPNFFQQDPCLESPSPTIVVISPVPLDSPVAAQHAELPDRHGLALTGPRRRCRRHPDPAGGRLQRPAHARTHRALPELQRRRRRRHPAAFYPACVGRPRRRRRVGDLHLCPAGRALSRANNGVPRRDVHPLRSREPRDQPHGPQHRPELSAPPASLEPLSDSSS